MPSRLRTWMLVLLALLCGHALAPDARPYQIAAPLVELLSGVPRVCAWLGAPLLLDLPMAAAETKSSDRAARALRESAASDALREALFAAAEPTRPELRSGRHFAPAEVLGRAPKSRDHVRVRLTSDARGILRGYPVVHSNLFVGRVSGILDYARGELEVELISGKEVFVGARPALAAPGAQSELVVGGLLSGRRPRANGWPPLALHNPSADTPRTGYVVVDESLSILDGASGSAADAALLANGFGLGELVELPGRGLALEVQLDFDAGLSQLFVLCPPDCGRGAEAASSNPLRDQQWTHARVLAPADPSPARVGLVLEGGALDGIAAGAAVLSGGRLIGRVLRARQRDCDVALLGDSSLQLVLVARSSPNAQPALLGRVLGRGPLHLGENPRLWWPTNTKAWSVLPRGSSFELFSAAGEQGLPAGLPLSPARISAIGEGGVEFELERPELVAQDVWVRSGPREAP